MKFSKFCVPVLLLCVLLANEIKQTDSGDVGKDAFMEILPLISGIAGMTVTGPVGPIVVFSLSIMQLATKILTADDSSNLSKTDFLESQAKIADAVKHVDNHVLETATKLNHVIESYEILEDMRNDLDTLREAFAHNMKVILDPKITGITKEAGMYAMLDYFSSFRQILRSFVSKYIKPKGVVSAQGQVKLFFDFILNKERIEVDGGDDCHLESTHTKLFKSYIYILKTLTDAYVMAVSAHTVHYQMELKNHNDSGNAIETQNFGLKLLNQYKNDMKLFMDKAKWAMERASREIRNCGTFEKRRGETFESILFAYTLPKFKDWSHIRTEHLTMYYAPDFKCFTPDPDVKYDDYEISNKCTDGGFKQPDEVKVFVNSTNSNWPYLYLELGKYWPWEKAKFLGHHKTGTGLVSREYYFKMGCYPLFCPAFKKNAVAISTQIVRAKSKNVITGLRFRIRENVIYIDIQEGKFLDDFSVDPKTVIWTETPKSKNILYLSANIRNLELGAVEVKENEYLTAIQLKLKNEADGIIGLYVGGGSRASNWTTSALTGSPYLDKSNELILSECDNPEQFDGGVKNMISKAPVASKPYHVSFQPTDLKKDFGITTIPYIDIREVYSNPPAPLAGFGIYHQTVKDSGGYIALKLITPNFSGYIDSNIIEAIKTTTEK